MPFGPNRPIVIVTDESSVVLLLAITRIIQRNHPKLDRSGAVRALITLLTDALDRADS